MMLSTSLDEKVDGLIRGPQYAIRQADKEARLLPILRELCREVGLRCPAYGRFLDRFAAPTGDWQTLADIPPVPVAMFKRFLLSAVPTAEVVRELRSSSTTGQQPSRIVIDKTTAFRQSRALVAILKEHIGSQRRPLLVLDAPESVGSGDGLSARGAAIRGIANFATETVFAMHGDLSGQLEPDWPAIETFFDRHGTESLLLFGFTYIVWTRFVMEVRRRGIVFEAPGTVLLHSGGWKRLTAEAVAKDEFNGRVAEVLGCDPRRILDFYGMVEQVGTVFVDCEAGNKHSPAFADVLIRRPNTLVPVAPGETGIIEVISTLPRSYPGQAIITEDQGVLVGVDDCPCGRLGHYFRFTRRIEQAEIRGCGDTRAPAPRNR